MGGSVRVTLKRKMMYLAVGAAALAVIIISIVYIIRTK